MDNLSSLQYEKMTEIQEKSLPLIIEGHDVIAQAKTGSGKTVSFSLPIILNLDVKHFRVQSLILAPTRELAAQVANELRKLARFRHNVKILELCGGVAYRPQVHSLFHGAHILVGTPGRILKHLSEDNIKCDDINTLVLDEADKMLDMGFLDDINEIISYLPKERQTLLFSATFDEDIKSIASSILNKPKTVQVALKHNENVINEQYYKVDNENKTPLISTIISSFKPESILIFCNTKIKCDELADDLYALGFDVVTLHSDLDQKDRDEVLLMFSNKSYPILIATDVASRGLDIDDITHDINFDMPRKADIYLHRIGRTGRAGNKGTAISLVEAHDMAVISKIERYMDERLARRNIPGLKPQYKESKVALKTPKIKLTTSQKKAKARKQAKRAIKKKKS